MQRLAIIDWGIGGVSIYKLVKEHLGTIPITYFSDTGATPYGKMSRSDLVARLNAAVQSLQARGVTHLIIGCNAASTAIPFLCKTAIKIEGMIGPAVALTAKLKPTNLGLIGGRRTVLSGVYARAFAECGIAVKQRIAQPLSALIESGDVSSAKLIAEAKHILAPLRNCSHILLACTHYPAITPVLETLVSPQTRLINPAAEMIEIIKKWNLPSGAQDLFLTTGSPQQMQTAAQTAFNVEINTITKINL